MTNMLENFHLRPVITEMPIRDIINNNPMVKDFVLIPKGDGDLLQILTQSNREFQVTLPNKLLYTTEDFSNWLNNELMSVSTNEEDEEDEG